ncbi:uncharacterized protein LOC6503090 isoform X1 [Drosophila ananassae]|uniref:uncharacterized protein LOC6503090 isoform X1 n=1 Tax=Drosophila ananassae TaxID=7217 RepID=UPI0013A5BF37|nr:uncharacterized protein LOC6503090 isoform X1 [Drosophila ananassae]
MWLSPCNSFAISAIFGLGILFLSVCQADEDAVAAEDSLMLEKGIASLSNVMVKYQEQFDNKVKFAQLQKAIEVIDISMMNYQGTAKNRLGSVREMNSAARIEYHRCVAPVFEWCISINSTFPNMIPMLVDENLTDRDKDLIWNLTVKALDLGLNKTTESLEILENVLNRTTSLRDLFKSIGHEIADDFGPKGFYGEWKTAMEKDLTKEQEAKKMIISGFIGIVFGVITTLVFGPIGIQLGFQAANAAYNVQNRIEWDKKQSLKEQIEAIDEFFVILVEKVENATKIVEEINVALEEDKLNLHALKGRIEGANNGKTMIKLAHFLRKQYAKTLLGLNDQCLKYVEWHGYNEAFYPTEKPRSRRDTLGQSEMLDTPEIEILKDSNRGGWSSPLPWHKDMVVHFTKHFQ